jgi:hypothetical protein
MDYWIIGLADGWMPHWQNLQPSPSCNFLPRLGFIRLDFWEFIEVFSSSGFIVILAKLSLRAA